MGRGKRILAMIVLVLLVAGVIALSLVIYARGLSRAAQIGAVTSIAVAVVGLALPVVRVMIRWLRYGAPGAATTSPASAAQILAETLENIWAAEERRRRVHDPEPLPVHWRAWTATADGALSAATVRLPGGAARAAGGLDEVERVIERAMPRPRLVILGPAGAGKTVLAVRLARSILARQATGRNPVPLVLSLATWRPADQGLTDWMVEHLILDHPGLAAVYTSELGTRSPLARTLVETRWLIPILDGLDELPESSRVDALAAINRLGSDSAVVLTCRTDEYRRAVGILGRGLSQAPVVELSRLDPSTVIRYLTLATAAVPENRWQAVFAQLRAAPDGPLAQALDTPLMVWLARTVYEGPDTTPGELADASRFGTTAAVQTHLLAEFIPAVFESEPAGAERRYPADKAQRWLSYLADWLRRDTATSVQWWRLPSALAPRGFRVFIGRPVGVPAGVVIGGCVGLAAAAAAAPVLGPLVSVLLGLTVAAPTALAGRVSEADRVAGDSPYSFDQQTRRVVLGRLVTLVVGVAAGGLTAVTIGLLAGVATGVRWAVAGGLVVGLLLHHSRLLPARAQPQLGQVVTLILRRLTVGLTVGIFFGVVAGAVILVIENPRGAIVLGAALGAVIGCIFAVVDGVNAWLDQPASIEYAPDPRSVLRSERRSALARGGTVAVGVGVGCGVADGLAYGPAQGVLTGALFGLAYAFGDRLTSITSTCWGRFVAARCGLALAGVLPWRLMAFLDEAHRRGVFRQVGAVYQFRHAQLQEYLATNPAVAARKSP